MQIQDDVSEGKILLTEIHRIVDIPGYIYLQIKTGVSMILPKEKLDQQDLPGFIAELEDRLSIKAESLQWRWK